MSDTSHFNELPGKILLVVNIAKLFLFFFPFVNVFLPGTVTSLNALLNQHSCHSAGRVVSKLQEYPFHLKLEIYI